MAIDVDALLTGPRGRRLCLEYALDCARRAGTETAQDAATAVVWAQHAFESGVIGVLVGPSSTEAAEFTPPRVSPLAAAEAVAGIPLVPPTPHALRDALAVSVDGARYWQEADGADVLAATPEFAPALRRVAEVIADAPSTQWWQSPVDLGDQWAVPWDGGGRLSADAVAELDAWRIHTLADDARAAVERPSDPTARWSGEWWSTPPRQLVHTTRSLNGDGPAGLWFVEDYFGGDEAVATPVDAYPGRVIEIDGPDDWALLCRRHPLDVTASRRHDWYRVTGRYGRWVIPDWAAVATEADAVHLTVRGYLTAATKVIEVDEERASVLAGWNPDETFWFRGVTARPVDQERWVRDDGVWSRAAQ